MSTAFLFNNKMMKFGTHVMGISSSPTPIEYTVTCSAIHGSVTATPSQGISGTLITLSNTPDSGYEFDCYTVNGITLVGNTFTLTEDVSVECVFKESADPLVAIVGTQKWMTKDLDVTDGQSQIYQYNGRYYYSYASANRVINTYYPGWRLPTVNDINTLNSFVPYADIRKLLREDQLLGQAYGTNEYRTSFLLNTGKVYYSNGKYTWENSSGYYRTSSTSGTANRYTGYLVNTSGSSSYPCMLITTNACDDRYAKKYLYPVHLIKD